MDYKEKVIALLSNQELSKEQKEKLENIFPELKESDDERIRKAIHNALKYLEIELSWDFLDDVDILDAYAWLEKQGEIDLEHYKDGENEKCKFVGYGFLKCKGDFLSFKEGETYWLEYVGKDNYNVRSDNLLGQTFHIKPFELYTVFRPTTWLEKQGESKPVDKVEPKFHEDNWITDGYIHCKITEILDDRYIIESKYNKRSAILFEYENRYHLWTIQDAKDGDVLVNGSNIFIFHFLNDTRLMGYCHVNTDDERFYNDMGKNECFCLIDAVVKPADKEQRVLLFQKMKEAGYKWNSVTKELKKINKFKIGDKVHCSGENQPVTIIGITNNSYITDSMIGPILFSEEDNWTLINHKFKAGDWIVLNGLVLYINEIVNGYYRTVDIDNLHCRYDWSIDNIARLWTIQDAKDGDVLASEDKIFLYNGKLDLRGRACAYCGIYKTYDGLRFTKCAVGNYFMWDKEAHPATKEQHDTLFAKMKEAEYEWDDKKKELKKIDPKKILRYDNRR